MSDVTARCSSLYIDNNLSTVSSDLKWSRKVGECHPVYQDLRRRKTNIQTQAPSKASKE
jgi:hypothetical protein